jgi:hypothetical protein
LGVGLETLVTVTVLVTSFARALFAFKAASDKGLSCDCKGPIVVAGVQEEGLSEGLDMDTGIEWE